MSDADTPAPPAGEASAEAGHTGPGGSEAPKPAGPGSPQPTGDTPSPAGPGSPPPGTATPQAAGDTPSPAADSPEPATDAPSPDTPQPAGDVTTQTAAEAIPGLLHGCPLDRLQGSAVVHCNRDDYLPLMTALKADGYGLPVGVTGVDYLTHPGRDLPAGIQPERFEVVVELLSLVHRRRIRARCQVPAHDPSVPTLFELWPGTEAHERETYDMYGISFDGHPDPSRILMPEDWEGHPLRKDYDPGHIPVQFKEAPK